MDMHRLRRTDDLRKAVWASRRPVPAGTRPEVRMDRVLEGVVPGPARQGLAARIRRLVSLPARLAAAKRAARTIRETPGPALFVEGRFSNLRHVPTAQRSGPAWRPRRSREPGRRATRRSNGWPVGRQSQSRGATERFGRVFALAGNRGHANVIFERRLMAAVEAGNAAAAGQE